MSKALLVIGLVAFVACVTAAVLALQKAEAHPRLTDRNGAVYLPRPERIDGNSAREIPVSWYRAGPGSLVVGTYSCVVSLNRGRPNWSTLVDRQLGLGSSTKVLVFPGPDETVLAVRWNPDKPDITKGGPLPVTLAALKGGNGEVLAEAHYAVPADVTPTLRGGVRWEKGCLLIFGGKGWDPGLAEHCLFFGYADGRIVTDTENVPDIIGWHYMDSRYDEAASSVIVGKNLPDSKSRIKVVRDRGFPSREVIAEDVAWHGALDLPSKDMLLRISGKKGSVASEESECSVNAYDLKAGKLEWQADIADGPHTWRVAWIGDGRIFLPATSPHCQARLYQIDCVSKRVEFVDFVNVGGVNEDLVDNIGGYMRHGENLYFGCFSVDARRQVDYMIFEMDSKGKRATEICRIPAVADRDEYLMGRGVTFLVDDYEGFWLGTRAGFVAYKRWKDLGLAPSTQSAPSSAPEVGKQ